MAKTLSNMMPLNTQAIYFSLPDVVSGKLRYFSEAQKGHPIVLMFICNHCPYVKHVNKALTALANDYLNKGVLFYAINSNDVQSYPDDHPDKMKKTAEEQDYPFPYLFDETQEVAKAYQAACTPDFYLFNQNHELVYRGQLDDARPGNDIPVTGSSLRAALDNVLVGKPVETLQKPSMGCNIKWKES